VQEIETWVAALGRYDNNEFDEALKEFDNISDTSKILFNCGVIHATLGEHEKAVCGFMVRRFGTALTHVGRMLSTSRTIRSIPCRRIFPTRRLKFPRRRFRRGIGQLQRYPPLPSRKQHDRLCAIGIDVQAILLRGAVQSWTMLHLPSAKRRRNAGLFICGQGEGCGRS